MTGRSDKKFCDDGCRNSYHNRLNSIKPLSVRAVNSILSRNRRIINQVIFVKGEERISEQKLSGMGFNFNYFTGQTKENDHILHHCYEFGYVHDKDGQYKMFRLPI